ncbi:MAG: RNase adapter RapZ, partial [bacterium]|nr:RNase adapter RapZ [bacterium]
MELLIISGMSGAGKSGAANALEDIGFYCIDNMPPALIKNFAELAVQSNELSRVAIVTDIRGGEHFKDVVNVLENLKHNGVEYKVLFLDASDECLVRRYKETRRKHPVIKNEENMTVLEAVQKEREVLETIRQYADYVVDTTYCSSGELKQRVTGIF